MLPQDQLKMWQGGGEKQKGRGGGARGHGAAPATLPAPPRGARARTDDLFRPLDDESNSIAILQKRVAGNMRSRWVDFLTGDGEKPDRNRDTEFVVDEETPESVKQRWEASWKLLLDGLQALRPEDLDRSVLV